MHRRLDCVIKIKDIDMNVLNECNRLFFLLRAVVYYGTLH